MRDVRRGAFVIEDLQPQDYVRLGELLIAYADLRLGFVDAAVLAVAERIADGRSRPDHRHFGGVRPTHTHALQSLPT